MNDDGGAAARSRFHRIFLHVSQLDFSACLKHLCRMQFIGWEWPGMMYPSNLHAFLSVAAERWINKRAEPNHPDQVVEGNERLEHCSKHRIKFKLLNKLWYIFFINVCLINLLSVALQKKCFDIYCMFTRFLLTFLLPTKNHVLEVYCELTTSISYHRGPFSFGPCQAVINDLAVP